MTRQLKVLLFIYMATLPVSSRLFDAFSINIPLLGSFSIIDIVILFLIAGLINKNRETGSNAGSLIFSFTVFMVIITIYRSFLEYYMGRSDSLLLFKSVLKSILAYLPLLLIIHKLSFSKLSHRFINNIVLSASIIIFISMIFRKEFELFYGIAARSYYIKEVNAERGSGYFAFGDINSMAIFQVMITAFFIYKNKFGVASRIYLIISAVISLMTIGITASRGAFVAMLVMLLFSGINFRSLARSFKVILLIFIVFMAIYLIKPQFYEAIYYRMFVSDLTEKDLSLKGDVGRIANMRAFIEYALNNTEVLWIGDVNNKFIFGTQTVHNAFLQMIRIGGLLPFVIFLYLSIKLFFLARKRKLVPMYLVAFIGLMTLPDYSNMFYLLLLMCTFHYTQYAQNPMLQYAGNSVTMARALNDKGIPKPRVT